MSAPAYTNDQGGGGAALHLGWKEYIKWRITAVNVPHKLYDLDPSTKYGNGRIVEICQISLYGISHSPKSE